MINLTLDEAKKIAAEGDYKVIPISCEFFSDVKTPIEVLRILKNISRHVYMLESIEAMIRSWNWLVLKEK